MTKILILLYQDNYITRTWDLVCFYESLGKELTKYGNEVVFLNVAYAKDYFSNNLNKINKIEQEKIYKEIKDFNPEIIFTFNNQIFDELFKITNCPICIFEADLPNLWVGKEFIKKHAERYYCASFTDSFLVEEYEKLGIFKKHIINLHMATAIKKEDKEKDKNISFIGTCFNSYKAIKNQVITDFNLTTEIKEYFYNNCKYNDNLLFDRYPELNKLDLTEKYGLLDDRLYILESLTDLGLNLYGRQWQALWEHVDLNIAFDNTPKYSLQDNQDIYNSSKINISISHPQCKGYSFPWRIYDIMASNGLLISTYSTLLKEKTKGYVDIPMYENRFEARDLCKKYLNEPHLCEDIINASNEFVEKFARWETNFEILENTFNIKIINTDSNQNEFRNYRIIKYELDYKNKNSTFKTRMKNILLGLSLISLEAPFAKNFYNNEAQDDLIRKIKKYIIEYDAKKQLLS